MLFKDFLSWEHTTRDIIDFKKIYVDIAGDVVAGLVLSELVYWYLPDRRGMSRLRVEHEGKYWIAVRRYEWWERTRMSPRQFDGAAKKLVTAGIIEKKRFKFNGFPTVHVRIIEENFLKEWGLILSQPLENPFLPNGEKGANLPNGKNVFTESSKPLTETTEQRLHSKESLAKSKTNGKVTSEETSADNTRTFADKTPTKTQKGRPRKKAPRDPLLDHSAVKLFRSIIRLTPNNEQRLLMVNEIGDTDKALLEWGDVLRHWKRHGWKPTNVLGMIENYKHGGIRACQFCSSQGKTTSPPYYSEEQLEQQAEEARRMVADAKRARERHAKDR